MRTVPTVTLPAPGPDTPTKAADQPERAPTSGRPLCRGCQSVPSDAAAVEEWLLATEGTQPSEIPNFSAGEMDLPQYAPASVGVSTRYSFNEDEPVLVVITFVWPGR